MWSYVKRLEYPVNIKNPNPAAAKVILDALGGPDGELGAANRYLSQRFTMPCSQAKGTLNDIGTEEPYPELKALLTDIGREASEMFHSEATAFFDAFATV